jgi:hypothetical protein
MKQTKIMSHNTGLHGLGCDLKYYPPLSTQTSLGKKAGWGGTVQQPYTIYIYIYKERHEAFYYIMKTSTLLH